MKLSLRRSLALTLTLLMAVGATPLFAAPTSAETGSRIEGRVFTADLRDVVAGLDVHAIPTGERDALRNTVTDRDGRFSLEGLPAGRYTLVLSDEGEPVAAAEITANAGYNQPVSLALPTVDIGQSAIAPNVAGASFITTWWGATLVLVGAAAVISFTADDLTADNPEREFLGSPSAP